MQVADHKHVRILWKQAKLLIDTLEPMLFLHTTAALMTIHPDKIDLQSECREKRSVFRRTFHMEHDCDIVFEKEGKEKEKENDKKPIHIVINPTAILNSIHKLSPVVKKILPKALDICAKQASSTPPELKIAKEMDSSSSLKDQHTDKDQDELLTKSKTKEILEISTIEWKWSPSARELSQKLNIYKNWQLLPAEVYELSMHRFYDASYDPTKAAYQISTHIGPTLNLDFIEMSILSPSECHIQVNPQSVRFVAQTSSSPDKGFGQAITEYSHRSDLITKRYWVVLPEYLLPEFWERHQYSINDIHCTLDGMPEGLIWQLLIAYHLSPTNAATTVCSDSELQLVCGGKSAAITKLIKYFSDHHQDWKKRIDVTWNMSKKNDPNGDGRAYDIHKRHVPNLPVHRLSSSNYHALTTKRNQLHQWRGISVIVVDENEDANMIRVKRVLPEREYKQKFCGSSIKSIRDQPTVIVVDDQPFVLMEESFFFYCNRSSIEAQGEEKEEHQRKRQKVV